MTLFRSMVLGALVVLGSSVAGAQATATKPGKSAEAQARREQGEQRGARGRQAKMQGRKALFRGVNLTDAQKQQVKTVVEKYRPEREALRTQMQELRKSGQKPDSTQLARFRAQHQAINARQVADIRALLTSEQKVTFDANQARMQERAERAAKHRGHGKRERRQG